MPHTLAPVDWIYSNPSARAADIMQAFADPSIDAIFATIGGSDAIRLIPYLDLSIIRDNPKVFLGYSDTTALHFACMISGVVSFYGPSIMSGFAENGGIHRYTSDGVRKALFQAEPIGHVQRNLDGWTCEKTDWHDVSAQSTSPPLRMPVAPKILQGRGKASGRLIGGCAEVLEMLKATSWWPDLEYWKRSILFYETSEDSPSPDLIRYWFRNFAAQGILKHLSGILIAQPDPAGDETYRSRLEQAIIDVLAEEGLFDLPILSGLEFGHTQPMTTLPYGVVAEIDCDRASLSIFEAATT